MRVIIIAITLIAVFFPEDPGLKILSLFCLLFLVIGLAMAILENPER